MRLEAFRGTWVLCRAVEDVRAGRAGRFEGEARFTAAEGGLDYAEEGTLRLGGAAYTASRRYRWIDGGLGTVEVRFADGRFFHRFRADDVQPAAVHDCPPDTYRVRYDFRHWPQWRTEWRVTGPGKDYTLASDYRPAGQGG